MGDIASIGVCRHGVPEANGAEPLVIERLEELLAAAKQGKFVAMAVVTVEGNGHVGTSWANPANSGFHLVGGCEVLKLRMIEGLKDG